MASVSTQRRSTATGVGFIPGSERALWYFLRVSGVILVFFALGHLFITHYVNIPSDTTFDFVSARWANPLWRTFDLILLFSALWHGLVGIRLVITDLIRKQGPRQIAYALLWIFGILFTILGTVTIVSFDEEMARNNTGPLSGEMWIGDLLGYSLYAFAVVTYIAAVLLIIWIVRNLRAGIVPVYNGDVGQYAWVLHRATGIGILFFLLVHILDIMLIGLGRDVYDHTVEFYAHWFIVPMEVMLVGAVIYHTLNGLRVIAINFSYAGAVREKKAFWWAMGATILLTIPSAIIIVLAEL
ncbi:MAG TPA: succinate dehydrogenase, cytochrome b556 subunit [Thermomicrobiales bacterium]|nr:succinate dehydrogenase, cytochrome b556 subunit [Thermomicrobiales bacterium]